MCTVDHLQGPHYTWEKLSGKLCQIHLFKVVNVSITITIVINTIGKQYLRKVVWEIMPYPSSLSMFPLPSITSWWTLASLHQNLEWKVQCRPRSRLHDSWSDLPSDPGWTSGRRATFGDKLIVVSWKNLPENLTECEVVFDLRNLPALLCILT